MKNAIVKSLVIVLVAFTIILVYSLVMPRVDLDTPAGQFEAFKK